MTALSPAAKAVLDATFPVYDEEENLAESVMYVVSGEQHAGLIAAAALRSAANDWQIDTEYIYGVEYIRTTTLEKIASELEGHQ